MALVICSNIRDDIIYQRNADYEAAYSFHNSLKQTLKIEPDSEVAVQSVKLSKSSNIIVKESDQWFQFFGKDLHKSSTTADNGPYYPIQCNPSMPVGFPQKSVNMEDFTALIKKGMNIGMPMPTAYGLQDFTINRDALGAYKGFQVKSNYLLTKGQNFAKENTGGGALNAAGSWESSYVGETSKITVTEGGGVGPIFTMGAGDIDFAEGGLMIKNTSAYPLSNIGGLCEFDVSNMATATADGHQYQIDFQIGLCRASSRDEGASGNGDADNGWVPYYDSSATTGMGGGGSNFESQYYDVVVTCEQVAGSGNRKLKVHQSVAAPNDQGVCLQEVEYFYAGNPLHTERIDMSQKSVGGNGVDLRKIKLTLSNEILTISFIDGKNKETIICDYATNLASGAVKKNLLAPIAQTRWNLYPKICAIGAHNGKNMQLTNFDAHPNTFNSWSLYNPDNNWYVRCQNRGLTGILASIDTRYMYDYSIGPDVVPTYIPVGIDQTSSIYEQSQAIQFIFAPSTLTYQHTANANMAITLGFEQSPVLAPSINGTAGTLPQVTYTSDGEPSLMTTASLFVRLDNFTQQSYNAGVGRPSKILYHLPRFDTSNREIGNGLFFEPTERTYVKINNSETIYANEMDISIANDNEQLATDLVGKTIVVLHFRKSTNIVKIDK